MRITGESVPVHHPNHHRASSRLTLQGYTATTTRILRQLAADHRSIALIVLVPILVITLMYFMFENSPRHPSSPAPFTNACLILLGLFPLFVMFIVTSITMQRERASGTLERILTTPLRRLDLLIAYGTAFAIAAIAQAVAACGVSFLFLGFTTAGSPVWVFIIAIVNAVLGVGLGLLCSAFAHTEFQAVQFIPLVMVPQLLLAGIIVPRALMPTWLEWISNAMPASYALEALQQVSMHPALTSVALRDIIVVLGFAIAALCLAAVTMRRRTP
ncbi:MAG: ABC transporter permease [Mycobacteriaceae bacterium]|nr:ABC transporter permease [Mycobacteriaceae bacterium]